ncbi:endonuclease domain-containing protein [Hyphomonas oceanitis]|uniref:endonuclease domain-containing protein n=1 Tax=Hyphomonas oceanitis TaxID=81033 RepID=UPI003001FDC3
MREAEKKTVARARALRRTMTRAEVILWQNLRARQLGGFKFRRQVPVGPFIADFACVERRLIIEVDGETHFTDDEIARDQKRTVFLGGQGWRVHRVWNTDIYDNLDGVLDGILYQLRQVHGD